MVSSSKPHAQIMLKAHIEAKKHVVDVREKIDNVEILEKARMDPEFLGILNYGHYKFSSTITPLLGPYITIIVPYCCYCNPLIVIIVPL